jgi:hypothetical protein
VIFVTANRLIPTRRENAVCLNPYTVGEYRVLLFFDYFLINSEILYLQISKIAEKNDDLDEKTNQNSKDIKDVKEALDRQERYTRGMNVIFTHCPVRSGRGGDNTSFELELMKNLL